VVEELAPLAMIYAGIVASQVIGSRIVGREERLHLEEGEADDLGRETDDLGLDRVVDLIGLKIGEIRMGGLKSNVKGCALFVRSMVT